MSKPISREALFACRRLQCHPDPLVPLTKAPGSQVHAPAGFSSPVAGRFPQPGHAEAIPPPPDPAARTLPPARAEPPGTALLEPVPAGAADSRAAAGGGGWSLGTLLISSRHCLQGTDTMDNPGASGPSRRIVLRVHPSPSSALAVRFPKGLPQMWCSGTSSSRSFGSVFCLGVGGFFQY